MSGVCGVLLLFTNNGIDRWHKLDTVVGTHEGVVMVRLAWPR